MNPDNKEKVPISQKLTLTIREAAAYCNIGINKIDSMLRTPRLHVCTFRRHEKAGEAQRI